MNGYLAPTLNPAGGPGCFKIGLLLAADREGMPSEPISGTAIPGQPPEGVVLAGSAGLV